jgi:hypothetical protein
VGLSRPFPPGGAGGDGASAPPPIRVTCYSVSRSMSIASRRISLISTKDSGMPGSYGDHRPRCFLRRRRRPFHHPTSRRLLQGVGRRSFN